MGSHEVWGIHIWMDTNEKVGYVAYYIHIHEFSYGSPKTF